MRHRPFTVSLLAMLLIGCASQSENYKNIDVNALIIQHQQEIMLASEVATGVALGVVAPNERDAVGSLAHQIALAVYDASADNTVDLTGVQSLAIELINKSNVHDKQSVGFVVQAVSQLVHAQLETTFAKLTADERSQAARSLLSAASSGVMQATSSFSTASVSQAATNPSFSAEIKTKVSRPR